MKHNILITSAGRRVSLVTYFQKELKKAGYENGKVFTTDLNPAMSSACLTSDGGIPIGYFSDPKYMDDLLQICLDNEVGMIVPTIDTELKLLAEHKAAFAEKGIHCIVSDLDFVQVCRDKRNMNVFFEKYGFGLPKMQDPKNPVFPMFVKPYSGSSSKDIYLVKDKNMLSEFLMDTEYFMHMEYLSPKEYDEFTVDLYYDKNSDLKCVVPRVRIAVRGGETNKGITRKNELVKILNKMIPNIPGAIGCLTLQVFLGKTNKKIYGIEINPRFGGGYPLSYLAGANYPGWLIKEYFKGEHIPAFTDWEDKLLLLRHDHEMIIHDFDHQS